MKTLLLTLICFASIGANAQTNYGGSEVLSGTLTASGITNNALTASRVVVSDANKAETSSAVTATELGWLSGVTSALQTQLNLLAPLASPTFTGVITGNGSGLTTLNAANISSGTVPTARLGSGSATSSTFLAGDQTWKTVSGGSGTVTSVDLSPPAYLTVSGNPISTSGTLTLAGNGNTAPFNSLSITNNGAFNTLNTTNRITGPLLEALDGSGANAAGTKTVVAGGNSTGTGAGGALELKTAFSGTTGSTTNTPVARAHYAAHQVALVHTTATTIGNVSLAAGKTCGLRVIVATAVLYNGEFQMLVTSGTIAAINKAGTVTVNFSAYVGGAASALSVSTFSQTVSASANGNGFDIKVNANSGLGVPVYSCGWVAEVAYTDDTGLTITDQ